MVPPRRGWADTQQVGRSLLRALPHCHKLNVGPSESVESREWGTPGESFPTPLLVVLLHRPGCWKRWEGWERGETSTGMGWARAARPGPSHPGGRSPSGQTLLPLPRAQIHSHLSEEGNRKETILGLEHKKSSPGEGREEQRTQTQGARPARETEDEPGHQRSVLALPGSKTR